MAEGHCPKGYPKNLHGVGQGGNLGGSFEKFVHGPLKFFY